MPGTVNPQDTVIFMLGQLDGKVGALKQSVDASATSQGTFNASMQTEINRLKTTVNTEVSELRGTIATNSSRIDVLNALRPIKHGWPVWLSAIAATIATLILVYTSIVHH